jgi:predicted DNA-binding transcriptional regulator AlpA
MSAMSRTTITTVVPVRAESARSAAELLGGLSRQRVSQLTAREDFPQPLAPLKMGSVWRYEDVAEWARRSGRTVHPLSAR